MNILLVGAGAVGKVYGRHLAMGGARVSFLVKDKHLEETKNGFRFYTLNARSLRDSPQEFHDFEVLSTLEEVKDRAWDYVILCMSSTGLRGEWLNEFILSIGNASLVSFQPGLTDRDYILSRFPADRLISGTIPILSFETPLPGEKPVLAGTAYWIPPGEKVLFSGPSLLREPLVAIFNRGGLRAKSAKDISHENVAAAPTLTLFIAALETCDWSLKKLIKHPLLAVGCLAMRQAVQVNAHKAKVSPPLTWFLTPFFFKALVGVAILIVPFPLETYLRVHFTKVQDQMHQFLQDYFDYAIEHNLPSARLGEFIALVKWSDSQSLHQ